MGAVGRRSTYGFRTAGRRGRGLAVYIAGEDALEAQVVKRQNTDGGWGYWRDTATDEFVTMQVVTAFAVPGSRSPIVQTPDRPRASRRRPTCGCHPHGG